MAHKGSSASSASDGRKFWTVSRRTGIALLTAAALYAFAAFLGLSPQNAGMPIVSFVVAMATAIVAVSAVRAWRESRNEPLVDERTKLLNRIATGFSWWFTYVLIAILLLVNQFKLATLTIEGVLSLVFVAMIVSLIGARIYLRMKGELE